MPRYRFQFETGHLYDGTSTEIVVKDFIAEIKKVTPALAQVIEARGGQLIDELPKAKRRKTKPVKWIEKEGEK